MSAPLAELRAVNQNKEENDEIAKMNAWVKTCMWN